MLCGFISTARRRSNPESLCSLYLLTFLVEQNMQNPRRKTQPQASPDSQSSVSLVWPPVGDTGQAAADLRTDALIHMHTHAHMEQLKVQPGETAHSLT